jgi:hypothetical protein
MSWWPFKTDAVARPTALPLPSEQQFQLDLFNAYHSSLAQNTPMRPDLLTTLIERFTLSYKNAQPCSQPNEMYALFLESCINAIFAFEDKADPVVFIEDTPSLFSHLYFVRLDDASRAMRQPFYVNQAAFLQSGMYPEHFMYPQYYHNFSEPEPTFTLRDPVDGDKYAKRDYREAKDLFKNKTHKEWADRKKAHEAGQKDARASTSEFIGTPLRMTFMPTAQQYRVPLVIDQTTRLQHTWIIADSGHGKTQLFQRMIAEDLKEVALGKRSVVVIDSQNKLIPTIAQLQIFAPGQPLHGKLSVLNPADTDLALNLFDLSFRPKTDDRQRQAVINTTLELYSFMFAALLEREMTGKQKTLFAYCAELLFHIPGATIRDFRDIMRKGGLEKHRHVIATLKAGSALREFFEHDFDTKEYQQTKDEVIGRLASLLRNPTFDAMFSQQHNKLDMLAEMNAGRVILVNTSQNLLKKDGVKFFGRFILALIGNAVAERSDMPNDRDKIPTYVYMDEAYEYIKDDRNFIDMLAQSRKQFVGLAVAQQWLSQLDEPVYDGLAAIASTVIAGGTSPSDAHKLGQIMHGTNVELIAQVPKLTFMIFVKGVTKTAAYVTIPWGTMENMPTMSPAQYEQQKLDMRIRFGVGDQAAPGNDSQNDSTEADDDSGSYDLHWEMTISPILARDGGKTREHGFILTIPAGLRHRERLRLKHKGRLKPDGTYGHIFITVNVPGPYQDTPGIEGTTHSETKKKGW